MLKSLRSHAAADSAAEADRHAYNAAFEELCLSWHWDAATHAGVTLHGRDGLRRYLQAEHPHLLRAYEADFLVNAIEAARARCLAAMGTTRTHAAPYMAARNDHSLERLAA